MDVNGTKFHLLHGQADWERLYLPGDPRTLAELWQLPEAQQPDIEWNQVEGSLHLARQPQLFRRAERIEPLDTALRRGAGRDRYGHWYWIDPNESGIRFLANGERQSALFLSLIHI